MTELNELKLTELNNFLLNFLKQMPFPSWGSDGSRWDKPCPAALTPTDHFPAAVSTVSWEGQVFLRRHCDTSAPSNSEELTGKHHMKFEGIECSWDDVLHFTLFCSFYFMFLKCYSGSESDENDQTPNVFFPSCLYARTRAAVVVTWLSQYA